MTSTKATCCPTHGRSDDFGNNFNLVDDSLRDLAGTTETAALALGDRLEDYRIRAAEIRGLASGLSAPQAAGWDEFVRSVGIRCDATEHNLYAALVSMQFYDITRQRFEHVADTMRMIRDDSGSDAGLAELCRLQSLHLVHAGDAFAEAVDHTKAMMLGIARDIARVAADAEAIREAIPETLPEETAERTVEALERIRALAGRLSADIENATEVAGGDAVIDIIGTTTAMLERIAVKSGPGDASCREAAHAAKMLEIENRYTMEQERAVHRAVSGKVAAAGPDVDGGEPGGGEGGIDWFTPDVGGESVKAKSEIRVAGDLTICNAASIHGDFLRAYQAGGTATVRFGDVQSVDLSFVQIVCATHRGFLENKRSLSFEGEIPGAVRKVIGESGIVGGACGIKSGPCPWETEEWF